MVLSGAPWRLGVLAVFCFFSSVALAAPAKKKAPAAAPSKADKPVATQVDRGAAGKPVSKEKTFDFAAMGIEGRVLAPQLLYLLGRIKVELERGDLEGRSFVPELVRSVDEGGI